MTISSVLVTGGAGFLGSYIVREVLQQHPSCNITVLDQRFDSQAFPADSIKFVQADITSPSELKSIFQDVHPQVVIHTAGMVPTLSERFARRVESIVMRINVDGTRNVLKAAAEAGCEAFIFTSSASALIDNVAESYANVDERWPLQPRSYCYGESKVKAEALVRAANNEKMATCILRPAPVFGEGDQQLIPPIHACIAKRETPYRLGTCTNLWDVVYVGNVAHAHVLAVENLVSTKSAAGETFFIQNNEPTSFREFSLAVWREFGHYPPFEISIPKRFGWILGLFAEWYTLITGTPTTLSRGAVLDACAMRYASGKKAKQILGYEPRVGLEESLQRSCRDYARRLAANSIK